MVLGSLAGAAPAARGTLRRLGRAIGRVIYLTDALEDLRRDFLRGEFNPCLAHRRVHGRLMPSSTRVRAARRLLGRELAALPRLLGRLPLRRHRDLLHNILCDQLRGRALRAGRAAAQWTSRAGHEELLHWRARPRLLRAAVVLLTATLGVWGFTRQAAAAVFHIGTRTLGRVTPGREVPAEAPLPLPQADSLCQRLGDRIVEFIRECCDIVGDCCESAVDGCSAPRTQNRWPPLPLSTPVPCSTGGGRSPRLCVRRIGGPPTSSVRSLPPRSVEPFTMRCCRATPSTTTGRWWSTYQSIPETTWWTRVAAPGRSPSGWPRVGPPRESCFSTYRR